MWVSTVSDTCHVLNAENVLPIKGQILNYSMKWKKEIRSMKEGNKVNL